MWVQPFNRILDRQQIFFFATKKLQTIVKNFLFTQKSDLQFFYAYFCIIGKPSQNNNDLVLEPLNEAIAKQKNVHGLILHSDQDYQHTSYEYKAICESNGIQISMPRKGTPIDDSPMKSFYVILKKETLYNTKNINEYQVLVEDWIEFYNTKRLKIGRNLKFLPRCFCF